MLARLLERQLPMSGIGGNETQGLSLYDWAKMYRPGAQVGYGGTLYQAFQTGAGGGPGGGSYTASPAVFAPAAIRINLFAEARFLWQQLRNGKPGDLFGNADLAILEAPWPGHTTADLLRVAEMDAFAAGNSYWVREPADQLYRLDPAHVRLLYAKRYDATYAGFEIGDTLIGYAYVPDKDHVTTYTPEEVCHYKPHPSPDNPYLGQSWISPCLPDVSTDADLTAHKQSVLRNGATLSTVVTLDPETSPEQFDWIVDMFNRQKVGPANANKPLFLGGGADVKTIGQTFENLALQSLQNAGEIRVAACAGIPPAIIGFSEGLKGSSLNAGNYGEARKRLSDVTMRPLWRDFAGSMQSLLPVPGGARLWYDVTDIAFLREDSSDAAQIQETASTSILKLIQAGYEPDAAVDAIMSGDLSRLIGRHTGLFSVQLQPPTLAPPARPSVATPPALPTGAKNGNNTAPPN